MKFRWLTSGEFVVEDFLKMKRVQFSSSLKPFISHGSRYLIEALEILQPSIFDGQVPERASWPTSYWKCSHIDSSDLFRYEKKLNMKGTATLLPFYCFNLKKRRQLLLIRALSRLVDTEGTWHTNLSYPPAFDFRHASHICITTNCEIEILRCLVSIEKQCCRNWRTKQVRSKPLLFIIRRDSTKSRGTSMSSKT